MWDGFWIIQQPICNEIQKTEPVLYVERPVSFFTVLRYPELWPRLLTWLRGARRLSENLRVLSPLPLFHLGHRFPSLFKLEFTIQRWWILTWARSMTRLPRLLWLDNPLYECAIGRMGESACVYHVGDEMGEFRTSHGPTVERLEDLTLKRASVVFAAADEMAHVRRAKNARTFAVQNAIDATLFHAAVPAAEFADVETIPAPRVGFLGVLDTWVDLDLLVATARALPNVSIVVVGPSRMNDDALRAVSNVHFLGVRHRRLVPGILRRLSVSLVPFLATPLTANIVPAKVFEALAAGIVPVCTAFSRNLDTFEERRLVLVARSTEQYIELVRLGIREDTPARRSELEAFGLRQTWSDRWREMKDILLSVPLTGDSM